MTQFDWRLSRATIVVLFLAFALCGSLVFPTQAATTSWTQGAAGANWFSSSNWDNGVPNSSTTETNVSNGGTAQIAGAPADAGSVLTITNSSTVELDAGGSLTATDIDVSSGSTLLLNGSSTIVVGNAIHLDNGSILDDTTTSLNANLQVGSSRVGTISAASGVTFTLTGNLAVDDSNLLPGSTTPNGTLVFGSATNDGTVVVSSVLSGFNSNSPFSATIHTAGGTLRAGNDTLATMDSAMTVDSGATLDVNDQSPAGGFIVSSLSGSGHILLGSSASTVLVVGQGNFSGQISGAGQLDATTICSLVFAVGNVCTSGALNLTTANTYSGGTSISSATVQIDNIAALGSGAIQFSAGTLRSTVSGTFANDVNIVGPDTIVAEASGQTLTITGNMTLAAGAGTQFGTATDTGTIIFNPASITTATFTGFAVGGGTLELLTSLPTSAASIGPGTLSGSGTIGQTNVFPGGTIAPGVNAPGHIAINGGVTFFAGSHYVVSVFGSTASTISVTGAATLAGTVVATASALPAAGSEFVILSASQGISGTFALATVGNFGPLAAKLTYDANDVFLDFSLIQLTPILPSDATQNERHVAQGIDAAIAAGAPLPPAFGDLFAASPASLASDANQLSGEIAADAPHLASAALNPFLNVLLDEPGQLDTELGGRTSIVRSFGPELALNVTDGRTSDVAASVVRRAARSARDTVNIWFSGFGERSDSNGDATVGSHSFNMNAYGAAIGIDLLPARDFAFGGALAAEHINFAVASLLGAGSSDAVEGGLYATKRIGAAAYVSAAGAYGLQNVRSRRTLTVSGTDILAAKYNAQNYAGRFEGGYRFGLGDGGLTPYLAVQAVSFHQPRYRESPILGSPTFAETFAARTSTDFRAEIGTGWDMMYSYSRNAELHLHGRLAWAHDAASSPTAHAAFETLPGSDFTTVGARTAPDSGLLGFAAELRGHNGLSLAIKFDGEVSPHGQTYFGAANFEYAW